MKSIKGVLLFIIIAVVVFWAYRLIFDLIEIRKAKEIIQYLKSEYIQKGAYPTEAEFYARYPEIDPAKPRSYLTFIDNHKYLYMVLPMNKGVSPYADIVFSYPLKSGWRWFAPGKPLYELGLYNGSYTIDPCKDSVAPNIDDRLHAGLPCPGLKSVPIK